MRSCLTLVDASTHTRSDRTTPIDRHPTLAGHLVRLLSSVLLPNTAFGVGEFLYNLCDRSPEHLVRAIGYGNASGFLQNRGELIPPPAATATATVMPVVAYRFWAP